MKIKLTHKKTAIGILTFLIIGLLYPLLTYKKSAEKAEELILVLKQENANLIERTMGIVDDKLSLSVTEHNLHETMKKILNSPTRERMIVNIDRYLEIYRIYLSEKEYKRFVEYMDEKRIFYQENNISIRQYLDEYKNELNNILTGPYMRITGYPKNELIKEEMKNGSNK